MDELRVSVWKKYGQDRLYVNRADGTTVAWYDRRTGRMQVDVPAFADAASHALAPYLTDRATPPPPDPPRPAFTGVRPALPPEFDLARNKPGTAVRAQWRIHSPGFLRRSLARVLRRPAPGDSWRTGLAGEIAVGRELRRLVRHGWRTLHSIQVSAKRDIDHLLIGPGGVFTINTKNHRGASIWVGDDSVKLSHRQSHPYVRKGRAEAIHAARVLERSCGFPVEVTSLLVFVRPASLHQVPSLLDVRALSERQLAAFGPLTGVLTPDRIEAVYAAARDQRTGPPSRTPPHGTGPDSPRLRRYATAPPGPAVHVSDDSRREAMGHMDRLLKRRRSTS